MTRFEKWVKDTNISIQLQVAFICKHYGGNCKSCPLNHICTNDIKAREYLNAESEESEMLEQIVIKLDKDIIESLNDGVGLSDYQYKDLIEAITNGTTLPKGHGRLIDADAYRKEMLDSREFDFFKRLDMQPTIIEADTESENKEEKR